MAIKGSLREASLPDVLQLLALGGKTGCLAVTDRSSFGYIYFDRGSICYASIVNRRDRLGDLLVKNGLVDPELLDAALEAQDRGNSRRLGEILVECGAITRAQLEKYVRLQIEEAVYLLFTWTRGSFRFETDQKPEEGVLLVSINPESLLLEGARRVDEWSRFEQKIPSFDLVFGLGPEVRALSPTDLTEEQRRILPLLDGGRSVSDVIDESGLVEFDAAKALFGLIQAGFAHPQGRKAVRAAEVPTPARIREHHNLGIAFFRAGMLEEASREFRRVLDLEPDGLDARSHLALTELRAGRPRTAFSLLRRVIESGGRSGSAFHNLALALESMGRVDDALLAHNEAVKLLPGHPQILLSRGVLLCKVGRMADAAEAFEQYATRLGEGVQPAAAYYAFAMIAEGGCGRLKNARRLAREAIEAYPHLAPVLLHAGCVCERIGAWEEAENLFRRAVESDPTLPQARKSLGDVLYHRGEYEEAEEHYRRALALVPELGDDVHCKLGNIRYKNMDRREAMRLWGQALELNPRNETALTNLELVQQALTRE